MPRSWTSSAEIHLGVDLDRPRGRRAELEHALREAIVDGRLVAGSPVPSSRALADELGVARGTVVDAYAQLVAEGYLATRPGAATVVTAVARPAAARPKPTVLASVLQTVVDEMPVDVRVNLLPGLLDLGTSFPRQQWQAALRSVLHSAPDDAFGYGDPRGLPVLRDALAAHLGRSRGVLTSPDQVVVTTGFSQGVAQVVAALRAGGPRGARAVAVEDPCLPLHRSIIEATGVDVVPVPVDADGLRTDVLANLSVEAVVVTPAHQYPTGVTLAPARRAALVEWARANDALVVEDDYDGEFRYDRQPVGAVQGLAPDHVAYIGTASKTLAPGLRLAWMVLPGHLVDPLVTPLARAMSFPPALEQLALAELLASGQFARHVRKLRGVYKSRRDQLVTALGQSVPTLQPAGVSAGLHVVASLPSDGPTEGAVRAAARARGVAMVTLGDHYAAPDRAPRSGIVVGYSCPPAHAFAHAVDELVATLHDAGFPRPTPRR